MRRTTHLIRVLAAAIVLLSSACEHPSSNAAPAQASEETFKDFGDFELHVNAVRTDQLTTDVARAYQIQRSKNRVLLNVTVLGKANGAPRKPVEAKIDVAAHNLNGQTKDLQLRRVNEKEAIYYIGEVSISGNEILVFDVTATPAGESRTLDLKFKREFFAD